MSVKHSELPKPKIFCNSSFSILTGGNELWAKYMLQKQEEHTIHTC